MRKLITYSVPAGPGQSFKGVKRGVIPNQSMSLQEIIRRFIKREALPQMKDAIYEDRYEYDLEKLSKADRTIQDEVLMDLKADVERYRKKYKDDMEAKAAKAAAVPPDPSVPKAPALP